MNHLQKLLDDGWLLEVKKDQLDPARPFHAQIFHKRRGSGHHAIGATAQKALEILESYVSSVGKPSAPKDSP